MPRAIKHFPVSLKLNYIIHAIVNALFGLGGDLWGRDERKD